MTLTRNNTFSPKVLHRVIKRNSGRNYIVTPKYVKVLLPVVVHRQAAGNVQAVHVEGRPTLDDPVGDDGAHAPGGGDAVAPHPRCHVVVVHLCGLALTVKQSTGEKRAERQGVCLTPNGGYHNPNQKSFLALRLYSMFKER
jgi:hypothetical protein